MLFRRKINKQLIDFPKEIRNFLLPEYQQINVARLQHLSSLGLAISDRNVIEFGAGIGDHTYYYLVNNSKVTPVEGRKELVDYISLRFKINAILMDLEKDFSDSFKNVSKYDIAHCYGILYHLSNPENFIKSVSKLADCIILETCVSFDTDEYAINLVKENCENSTQAIGGVGCRPNRKWIFDKIQENFKHSYMPSTQPKHAQFPKSFNKPSQGDSRNIRAVFIGSNTTLKNQKLYEGIVDEYNDW